MNLLHLHYSDKKFKSCISNTIYFILIKKRGHQNILRPPLIDELTTYYLLISQGFPPLQNRLYSFQCFLFASE
jgi:hypothetical protein